MMKVLSILLVMQKILNSCLLYQESTTSAIRKAETIEEQTPQMYNEPTEEDRVCEDFIGKNVCCTESARTLLQTNFYQFIFINCQNSLNNLKRFWCHIHCSTNQEDYIKKIEYIDYQRKEELIKAITVSYELIRNDACGVFTSNQKISLFQQLEQTKSLMGFFKFFGDNAIQQIPDDPDDHSREYVAIFSYSNKGLNIPFVQCSVDYEEGQDKDKYNYPIDPSQICTCQNCQEKCKQNWDQILKDISIWNGFTYTSFLWLILLFLISLFAQIMNSVLKKKNKSRDKAKSIDSYERIKEELMHQFIIINYLIHVVSFYLVDTTRFLLMIRSIFLIPIISLQKTFHQVYCLIQQKECCYYYQLKKAPYYSFHTSIKYVWQSYNYI